MNFSCKHWFNSLVRLSFVLWALACVPTVAAGPSKRPCLAHEYYVVLGDANLCVPIMLRQKLRHFSFGPLERTDKRYIELKGTYPEAINNDAPVPIDYIYIDIDDPELVVDIPMLRDLGGMILVISRSEMKKVEFPLKLLKDGKSTSSLSPMYRTFQRTRKIAGYEEFLEHLHYRDGKTSSFISSTYFLRSEGPNNQTYIVECPTNPKVERPNEGDYSRSSSYYRWNFGRRCRSTSIAMANGTYAHFEFFDGMMPVEDWPQREKALVDFVAEISAR
jgi:hypothetical protein